MMRTKLFCKNGSVYIFVLLLLGLSAGAYGYEKPPEMGLLAKLTVAVAEEGAPAGSEEWMGKIQLEERAPLPVGRYSHALSERDKAGVELSQELESWAKTLFEASRKAFKPPRQPYGGEPLALQDCLKRGLEVHGPAVIAREEFRLAKLRYWEALRNLFPTATAEAEGIEGTTTGDDFRGRGIELKMQQPLWDGAKKWKLFKQAKINLEIAKKNYEKIILDLEADVRRAYIVAGNAQKNLEARMDLAAEAEKVFQSARERMQKNVIREVEFLAVENQFTEITYQANAAEREWVLAQLSLKQILRLYEVTPVQVKPELPASHLEIPMEKCLELAYQHRPDYLLSKLNVNVQRYGREIAGSETGFQLNADGSVGYRAEDFKSEDLDFQDEFFVGLSGTLPLWHHVLESNTIVQDTVPSAGQTTSTEFKSETLRLNLFSNTGKSRRLEAVIRYHRALDDLEKIKRNLLFQVGQTYFESKKAWEGMQNALEKLKLEEKEVQLTEIQVGLNEAALADLMTAMSQKTNALIEYQNAIAAYQSSLSELNKAVGGSGIFPAEESIKLEGEYSVTTYKKDTYDKLFGDPQ